MNIDERAGDAGMSAVELEQRVSMVSELIEHERALERHTIKIKRELPRLRKR